MRRLPGIAFAMIAALCGSVVTVSAQTCTTFAVTPADGRVVGPYTNDGITVASPYFQAEAGRSYSIEVRFPAGTRTSIPTTGAINTVCPTVDSGTTDTLGITPKLDSPAYRVSVTPGSAGFIVTRVNSGTFTYSVSETTLFNPSWSTGGTYATQWGLQNTSASTITGTLTVRESFGGSATYTKAVSLPANSTTFVTSFDTFTGGPIPSGRGGSAMFAHSGPPNTVQGDVFIVSSSGTVFPSIFRALRDVAR